MSREATNKLTTITISEAEQHARVDRAVRGAAPRPTAPEKIPGCERRIWGDRARAGPERGLWFAVSFP